MRLIRLLTIAFATAIVFSTLPMVFAEEDICALPAEPAVEEVAPFELEGPTVERVEDGIPDETPDSGERAVEAPTGSDFEIKDGVLEKYTGLDNNVVIPKGVTTIGYSAFNGDNNLESVTIPDGVTCIEFDAFSCCGNLKSVALPDSITEIQSRAFSYCTNLNDVVLPPTLGSIASSLFTGCDSLKEITIPSSVNDIGPGAFSFCDSLERVVIQDGVASIDDAFSYCKSLESVFIPSSVTKIDRTTFNKSPGLVIRGTDGSYAEQYARSIGIPFNAPIVTFEIGEDYRYLGKYVLHISRSLSINAVQKPADLAATLVWSSSNESVATVDPYGTVTAVAEGAAIITANTADGRGKPAAVTITVPEPTSISIYTYDDPVNMTVDELMWLSAYYYTPSTDSDLFPVKWSSSDDSIVSIESSGKTSDNHTQAYLRANRAGSATITASTADTGSVSVVISVNLPKPDSIEINEDAPDSLLPGDTLQFTASITPSNASTALTWYSSDPDIAAVDGSGAVTAVAPGTATISVKTDNNKVSYRQLYISEPSSSDPLPLPTDEPSPAAPTQITVNRAKAALGVREKLALAATLTPADAVAKLTWKSSDKNVATVSKKGVVTAKKKGTAVITVSTDNGLSGTIRIAVKPAPTKVTLNRTGTVALKKGKKLKLKATLSKGSASALTWTSSNSKVARVDWNGRVTALKKGTATITVKTFNGKKATIKITVKK